MKMARAFFLWFTAGSMLVTVDWLSKAWAEACVSRAHQIDWVALSLEYNRQPPELVPAVAMISLMILALLWTMRLPMATMLLWTAGGLANVIELLATGQNVDWIGIRHPWSDAVWLYNFADFYIYAGTAILVFYALARRIRVRDLLMFSRWVDFSKVTNRTPR